MLLNVVVMCKLLTNCITVL